jgi:hypothetical protein
MAIIENEKKSVRRQPMISFNSVVMQFYLYDDDGESCIDIKQRKNTAICCFYLKF